MAAALPSGHRAQITSPQFFVWLARNAAGKLQLAKGFDASPPKVRIVEAYEPFGVGKRRQRELLLRAPDMLAGLEMHRVPELLGVAPTFDFKVELLADVKSLALECEAVRRCRR